MPPVEAGWGGGLPTENLDQSPRGAPVRRYGSPRGWPWSEDREDVDYFASEPTAGDVGSGSA